MVKLRSGKSYLDRTYFNNKVDDFNELILFITNKVKVKNYKIYLKNLVSKEPNIYKDFNNIVSLRTSIKVYEGSKGGKYYISKGKKNYITKKNKNYYIRNEKIEELSLLILKFINNYEKVIKNYRKIEKKYVQLCSICYSNIKQGDKIVTCINTNNIIHPYHKTCFDTNLHYVDLPYVCKTIRGGETNRLYECPYCRQKRININKVYTVM